MEKELKEVIREVHELLREKGSTLSVAESCTGGLISHSLTSLPGASSFFVAGIVAYSAEIKEKILGVSSATLARYGVVSEQTAAEMAEKIRGLTNTDFAVSTTGNLGPDVLETKGKGLVYVAVSREGETSAKELRLQGNREENKEEAAFEALKLLIEIIQRIQ
jgi:PncC family amidohydrolase